MAQNAQARELEGKLEALAGQFGFELVDAGIEKEGPSRYYRIYIDKPGGITLKDCEAYHRACIPLVEHVDYDFLEVCSWQGCQASPTDVWFVGNECFATHWAQPGHEHVGQRPAPLCQLIDHRSGHLHATPRRGNGSTGQTQSRVKRQSAAGRRGLPAAPGQPPNGACPASSG